MPAGVQVPSGSTRAFSAGVHVTLKSAQALRCPYCRDDLSLEADVKCTDCSARSHAVCWSELGGCPTCGRVVSVVSRAVEGGQENPLISPSNDVVLAGVVVVPLFFVSLMGLLYALYTLAP